MKRMKNFIPLIRNVVATLMKWLGVATMLYLLALLAAH